MKNQILKLLALMLVVNFILSCNQKADLSSISEKITLLEKDPITNEYFESLALMANVTREFTKEEYNTYKKIITQYNNNPCNIEKEIISGNIKIIKYAEIACRTSNLKRSFNAKYTFIRNMREEDRKELFAPFVEKFFKMNPIDRSSEK